MRHNAARNDPPNSLNPPNPYSLPTLMPAPTGSSVPVARFNSYALAPPMSTAIVRHRP
jgi:hypothetical protein